MKKHRLRGLKIHCSHCGSLLVRPGALMFSPPDKADNCVKHHLCQRCWDWVVDMLFT